MPQAAGDPGRGRSGGEPYGFVLFDELCRSHCNVPFFFDELLFPRLKSGVVAKRFIQKLLNECCATMRAPNQPL